MANTWEQLDPNMKRQLARQMMSGKSSNPDNLNRAMEVLAQNPNKVKELLQETGVEQDDMELTDAAPDEEQSSIDDNIERALSQHGSADMQETGRVASDIPPPEPGEDIQAYMQRLMMMMQDKGGRATQKAMGGQASGNVMEEDVE